MKNCFCGDFLELSACKQDFFCLSFFLLYLFFQILSDDKQADVIDAFNTTTRYLDNILNINNVYFDNMVSQIYPSELQLNEANTSGKEVAFKEK